MTTPSAKEPPHALLMSMATCLDHAIGCNGYYDIFGQGEHQRRVDQALSDMRKIYDEVVGKGYYKEKHTGEAWPAPRPIEEADKSNQILVLDHGIWWIAQWDNDDLSNDPRPFWRMGSFLRREYSRLNQPTMFWPLPERVGA